MATSLSSALEAMERSRILMVIFTPEFLSASDKLLIERLQKVMEYHKSMNRPVVPVFGGAKQKQVVEHLATRYKDLDWIGIAVEAASQSGVKLSIDLSGVTSSCERCTSSVDGTNSMIGIWGAAGIGKSTFARAIYDNGWQMKKALYYRSAVVVFDDVNHIDQLIALCGSSDPCFGERSLVLVTLMNKDLLLGLRLYLYEMKTLDESDSLELFSRHAFKKSSPTDDFMSLSGKAINFCEGLPLALEIIGSLLLNRTKKEWNNVLKKLRGIPRVVKYKRSSR
ncbi:TMV resistance protein N-like [Neltuma alba]|uniref:TMV resistance protein N-like n=1 Tax=Neltuma alba TaxID=207710 RepID=UPI0010A2AFDF|nr:TMV resistance protein N-like [Prosopis alba]